LDEQIISEAVTFKKNYAEEVQLPPEMKLLPRLVRHRKSLARNFMA